MDEYGGPQRQEACKICGRTFNIDVLAKHKPICQKNVKSQKKRKVFDSGKQRAAGSDIPYNATLKPGQAPNADPAKYAKAHEATRNNWRFKHEQLMSGMQAARGDEPTPRRGGGPGMGGNRPPMVNPNMSSCGYCGRTFNKDRLEKHESICGEQARRAQRDMGNRGGGRGRGTSRGGPMAGGRGIPGQPATRPSPSSTGVGRGGPSGMGRSSNSSASTSMQSGSHAGPGSGGPRQRQPMPTNSRAPPSDSHSGGYGRTNPAAATHSRGSVPAASPAPAPAPARHAPSGGGGGGGGLPKFCGGCGTKFSGTTARFCGECGQARA